MNIRSITLFCSHLEDIPALGSFARTLRGRYQDAGYEVQTLRLATLPFPRLLDEPSEAAAVRLAQRLEAEARAAGFDYLALGPAQPDDLAAYALIPPMLAATENVFASGAMTTEGRTVSLPAVRACAQVIRALAGVEANGFGNLYFAALANVPPGAPFFPAAYHAGEAPAFALALEAADLAVTAFEEATSLEEARRRLRLAVEAHGARLTAIAAQGGAALSPAPRFGGLDFSLAPYPEEARSLGTAFERLGVSQVGLHGSLAAAALITETVRSADFPRTGFSGLMLPVLEDATLARRAAEGVLRVKDLLLYSAVCGTGLDTVPLPGDATVEQLSAVLLDLAALAVRLDKPLTARLMPVPGKQAGEPTDFDFPYFANSRVMALDAAPLKGAFAHGLTGAE